MSGNNLTFQSPPHTKAVVFWERGQEALSRATLFIPSPHLFSLRALHLCHAQEYLMGPGVGLMDGCRWCPALLPGVPCSTGRFCPLALCTVNPSVPAFLTESPPEEPCLVPANQQNCHQPDNQKAAKSNQFVLRVGQNGSGVD